MAAWAKTIGVDMDPNAAELNLWANIIMGFCGKHVEVAEQFLMESDRDPGPRGQRMRKLGEMIMDSLVRIVPMSPYPAGAGFNIRTGKVIPGAGLRSLSEDMRILIDMLRRERRSRTPAPGLVQLGQVLCRLPADSAEGRRIVPVRLDGNGRAEREFDCHQLRPHTVSGADG